MEAVVVHFKVMSLRLPERTEGIYGIYFTPRNSRIQNNQ
jgi:hypothetical protein